MMKHSLAIFALAALIAWPAVGEAAAKKKKTVRHKPAPVAEQRRAPSYVYGPGYRRPRSPNPAWDVYFTDGTYAGSDPDPLVRDMLSRDDPRNRTGN
jgi:hypothetical protein